MSSTEEAVAGRVGIVLPISVVPSYRILADGLEEALDEAGHETVIEGGIATADEQTALVQRITGRDARGIVIAPLDSATLRPALDAAAAESIPVFTVGLPVRGARVTTHMEPDYHAAGVIAAEYLATFVGPAMHAAVVGNLGAHGSRGMAAAFQAAVVRVKTRAFTGSAESGGTAEGAAAAVTALLAQDPDLDAVFALDPASAQGAMSAALARRRADLVIVSFGATPEVVAAVRDGRPLRAAIVERPDEGARLLGAAIATQLEGEPVTPSIRVPVRLVTSDSVKTASP